MKYFSCRIKKPTGFGPALLITGGILFLGLLLAPEQPTVSGVDNISLLSSEQEATLSYQFFPDQG